MRGWRVSTRPGLLAIGVALALLAAGCASTPRVPQHQRVQAQDAYERGIGHLGAQEWAAALTALRQANAFDPAVPLYRNALGVSLLQLGRPGLALAEFQRAAQLDLDYAEAHLNAGIALAQMARWSEAVEAYERALALPRLTTPDTAHGNLGWALYNLQRYTEAESALRFAISLEPQMEAAWYHLGLVLVAQDRRDEAKGAFRRARDLAPHSPFGEAAIRHLQALGDGG